MGFHYRQVDDTRVGEVASAVDEVLGGNSRLVKGLGKKVFELQPNLDWHKGKAVFWLLEDESLDAPVQPGEAPWERGFACWLAAHRGATVVANLVVDVLYAYLDPRIRY